LQSPASIENPAAQVQAEGLSLDSKPFSLQLRHSEALEERQVLQVESQAWH
jgi:hypothetical protein